MTPANDLLPQIIQSLEGFLDTYKAQLLVFATSAVGSGFGAWYGARAALSGPEKNRAADIQSTCNIAIASMIALLGKLLNVKKDQSAPALAEADTLDDMMSGPKAASGKFSIKLELWPEIPFALRLPNDKIFEYAGGELDVIQLLKMLDYSLAELSHLVRQRNELIRSMNAHQSAKGALPVDGLRLYIRYAREISRNVDENLFFIDHAIGKVRDAARKLLPAKMHRAIAEIGLKPETQPLTPPRDLIKGIMR